MQVVDYEINRIAEAIIKVDLIRGSKKAKYVKKKIQQERADAMKGDRTPI